MSENMIYKKALEEIASYNHESYETPQWFKDMAIENLGDQIKDWKEEDFHESWREEEGYQDSALLEAVVEIARDALKPPEKKEEYRFGDFNPSVSVKNYSGRGGHETWGGQQ